MSRWGLPGMARMSGVRRHVFRPLPFACAAMALLLAVKAREVTHALGGAPAALLTAGRAVVSTAEAAAHVDAPAAKQGASMPPAAAATPPAATPPAAPTAATPPAAPTAAAPASATPTHAGTADRDAAPHGTVAAAGPAAAAPAPPQDPPVGESERALLLDLRARRGQIEAREQALATRDAVLAAAEKRIGERVEQLQALQAKLEAMDAARRERDDANWRGLVKTYEVMRPRDAAAILNELEMPVLLQVLDRMREGKAAGLLAAMQPDRARAATAQLAAMRTRAAAPPDVPPPPLPPPLPSPHLPPAPGGTPPAAAPGPAGTAG